MTALGKLFRTTALKLSLAYLVIFSIGAGLVLGRVALNVKSLVDQQIAQTIAAQITGLAEQYSQGGIRRLVKAVVRRTQAPGASLYLVTTPAGETIAGNVAVLPAGVLDHPGVVETQYQRPGEPQKRHRALARIFRLPGGFHLLVGRDLEDRETLRAVIGHALITSLFWLVAIGTIGGIFVALRVLRRVDAMSDTARKIMSGDLTRRLQTTGSGDELDRLAQNLNAMLERISELMAGLKEVSDNIAHDLKTPLTRVRSGVEQALRTAVTPAEYRASLEKLLEESDGLIRIFDALLMIARVEAGADREGMQDFDASKAARDVGELYEPLAEAQGVTLTMETEPGLWIHGNRELIGQALANLVDNALKYGSAEGCGADGRAQVCIKAQRAGALIEMSVADRGPGIEIADRGRVLGRFVRLEGSRSRPGSGLGLSLAAAVARLHDGELRIEDNMPGLRVVLAAPLAFLPGARAVPAEQAPQIPQLSAQ
ncbi:MAG TPA: HAMP domain-containing sensor histidine kinase [Beijerinckiaceae bacterium]|nr:HAMP domain-containing sensor histidine kinase [Beijerinckiaceae bacterium]HVB88927.1 HAMP domain-containing sensor histidine kinase [Beijerinckiaceae bacterium]